MRTGSRVGAFAVAWLAGAAALASAASAGRPLALTYDRPAGKWTEALPVGNGRIGAMVFGGTEDERLQATSFRSYRDIDGDAAERARAFLARAANRPYTALRLRHVNDFTRLFSRVTLNLGNIPSAETTDKRIKSFADNEDPALVALYFAFGRYLLISSSRPGGQPATLQGIWNEELLPAWSSKWTTNINLEMNYWPADTGDLWETQVPSTLPNMFDLCPPFQIDGNLGGPAAIAEMLVQSKADEIRLLPALPRQWSSGSLKGIRVRGGGKVDIAWKDGQLTMCRFQCDRARRVLVRCGEHAVEVLAGPGRPAVLDGELRAPGAHPR